MDQGLVSGFIEDSEEVRRSFEELLPLIPIQEPANGGPTDEQFMSGLAGLVDRVRTRKRINVFPSPFLTSAKYDTKR